jgi:TFIIF-interacting CTD phosphatase-like protein
VRALGEHGYQEACTVGVASSESRRKGRRAPTLARRMSVKTAEGTLTCIVLDLDETLVNTRLGKGERQKIHRELQRRGEGDRYYEFKLGGVLYWGVKRPYYRFFLDYCFASYDVVVVWTAAERDYATQIVNQTFPMAPHVFWCREQCTFSGGLFYKPIAKLFKAFPDLSRPDTVHLDDRRDVAKYNPEYLLEISSYNYKDPLTFDRALVIAMTFLRDAALSGVPIRDVDKDGIAW